MKGKQTHISQHSVCVYVCVFVCDVKGKQAHVSQHSVCVCVVCVWCVCVCEWETDRQSSTAGLPCWSCLVLQKIKQNACGNNHMMPMENENGSKNKGANGAVKVTEFSLIF